MELPLCIVTVLSSREVWGCLHHLQGIQLGDHWHAISNPDKLA